MHNKKTEYNGHKYDSKLEAAHAQLLDISMHAVGMYDKVISYERQVPFLLQEAFVDKDGTKHRKIEYLADFVVTYADGRVEVQDTKGFKTEVYKIKKKMLLFKHKDINFREVR